MTTGMKLKQFLLHAKRTGVELPFDLIELIHEVSITCKEIAATVSRGELSGVLGVAGSENVQGETQKELDIITNDIMVEHMKVSGLVAGMGSEEVDDPISVPAQERGEYILLFDPLDGSSNIDVNISVGTIFSVLKAPMGCRAEPSLNDYHQKGTQQRAAGFVVYGPSTVLVLTTGQGVNMFTLDNSIGEFVLTKEGVEIPEDTKEFAINLSNKRFWEEPMQQYIEDCLQGEKGPLGKRYNMRWVASMVAEVFRILVRGGIFMYPYDNRDPSKAGKLRLMYEANPMSFIIEQAGGMSSTGHERIMDVEAKDLHQRVPVILGSRNEVAKVVEYHLKDEDAA
ncbi:MAG: class 1 fructose-bisphosphatase [Gammaproteobacteria bacterium]|nr:class 1 fructose-bisphosphatase [Gammaproteobacteria bacterium]MDH5736625.1 class 1 fructose-bisphosphatase [Gammaproteobacteria bacterium]